MFEGRHVVDRLSRTPVTAVSVATATGWNWVDLMGDYYAAVSTRDALFGRRLRPEPLPMHAALFARMTRSGVGAAIGGARRRDIDMIPKIIFAAGLALVPQLAAAQAVVVDPQLLAVARQQLVVQQQTLAVLNAIEALELGRASQGTATAALAYAQRQGQDQAQVEQTQQQAVSSVEAAK